MGSSDFIPGDLFSEEAVQRLVVIQGPDHIIPVLVGIGPGRIGVAVTVRVGVPGHIQPMPRPAPP